MSAGISTPLAGLTVTKRRWNGSISPGACAWATPATNRSDRPYGDLARREQKTMAARRDALPGPMVAIQDQPLAAAAGQTLPWRSQAVSKLAAARWDP